MAMPAKGKKPAKKGLKTRIHTFYKITGGRVDRLRKFCPVCGPGVFMAKHKDRWSCGKCGYTEWIKEKK